MLELYPTGIGQYSQQSIELSNKHDIGLGSLHSPYRSGMRSKAKSNSPVKVALKKRKELEQLGITVHSNTNRLNTLVSTPNAKKVARDNEFFSRALLMSYVKFDINVKTPDSPSPIPFKLNEKGWKDTRKNRRREK
jgi:hypothetical protein